MRYAKETALAAAKPPKIWKSYAEQISLLRERGLIIEDEAVAGKALASIGYYRLSGYAYPFRAVNSNDTLSRLDSFIKGSRFADIVALYAFDCALRLLVLEAMEIIEPAIQTRLAHRLGKYSPLAHEEKDFWHIDALKPGKGGGASYYEKWQEDYQGLVKRSQRASFIKHNLEKYGCLPIWVAIEIFDFGAMSKLYAGMRDGDRDSISKEFGLVGSQFTDWLRGLNFIRNMAAHHRRLWNCNILERATPPRTMSNLSALRNSRPFLYFCLMQSILRRLGERHWGEKFKELLRQFPAPQTMAVRLEDMGVAAGWENWEIWR